MATDEIIRISDILDVKALVPEPEEKTPEHGMKGDGMLNSEYKLTLSPTTSEINPEVPESMLTSPTLDEASEQEVVGGSSMNNLPTDEGNPTGDCEATNLISFIVTLGCVV